MSRYLERVLPAGWAGPGSQARDAMDLLSESLRGRKLIPPTARLGTLPFNVLRGDSSYYTDFDFGNFVTGQVMYLNSQIGSDANDGLTSLTPKKSLAVTLAAGGRVIYVSGLAPAIFTNVHCLWDTVVWPDANIAIIGLGPRPIFFCGDIPATWTLVGGSPNCYSATVTAPINVVDFSTLDSYGNPTPLTLRANQAALTAAPEGFFVVGTTVTIKLTDLSAPAANRIGVLRTSRILPKHQVAGRSVYMQNIAIMADRPFSFDSVDIVSMDLAKKFVTADCLFGYARTSDALSIGHVGLSAQFRTIAAYADADCFNYTSGSGITNHDLKTLILEEQVLGYRSGCNAGVDGYNQCSTAHEGCRIVRVASRYMDSGGPIVQDQAVVGFEGGAWLVGCTLAGSRGTTRSQGYLPSSYDNYLFDTQISGTLGDVTTNCILDRCRVGTNQSNRAIPYRQEFE